MTKMVAFLRHRSVVLSVLAFTCTLGVMTLSAVDQTEPQQKDNGADAQAPTGSPVIWHDPGDVARLDFVGGVGGRDDAPKQPFTFEEENLRGSNPKVSVKDAKGVKWSVKFGPEVNAETFATRIVWATGYFVEPDYFVPQGRIEEVGPLTRAKHAIKADGTFANARFEMHREKGVKMFDGERSWSWLENPFVGTKELNGLKIVMMLVSNWDNKD